MGELFNELSKIIKESNILPNTERIKNIECYINSVKQKEYSLKYYKEGVKNELKKLSTSSPSFIVTDQVFRDSDQIKEINRNFDGFIVNARSLFDSLSYLIKEIYPLKRGKLYFNQAFIDNLKKCQRDKNITKLILSKIDVSEPKGWFHTLSSYRDTTIHKQIVDIEYLSSEESTTTGAEKIKFLKAYLPENAYSKKINYIHEQEFELIAYVEKTYGIIEEFLKEIELAIKNDKIKN